MRNAVKSVDAFSRDPDDTELDIRIETDTRLIVFELKTQSNLRTKQISKQTRYLTKQEENEMIESWDYILLTQAHQRSTHSHPHLRWDDVHRELAATVGQVESDTDLLRLHDWMRSIDQYLVDQRDFGPKSKLVLRYGETLDELGIPYDAEAYIRDRVQLFKRLRKWLRVQYDLSSETGDEWTSRTLQSRIQRNTDIYRIGKKRWKDVGVRFEVLARDKRLKHGTDHDDKNRYRSLDSLIEVTLRHIINKRDTRSSPENPTVGAKQRERLHDKLVQGGQWESLRAAGFRRTRDLLTDEQSLNRYHQYSREIMLFDRDGAVFPAVRDAVETLMNTQSSIDEFVEAEQARKE